MSANMGNIELNMAILTGAVGGVLLIGAEMMMMHKKVARYRDHLRGLHRSGRGARLLVEAGLIAVVALVQPVIISMLTVMALGSFNPAFSANAAQQLKGEPGVERPLRNNPHNR
ncbi:MAG TPA: hypothetical protein VIU46_08675 [Gallionellaceae bacterium]